MALADCSVSVIVASRGRGQDLAKCVDSILGSSFDQFELIVVEQLEPGQSPARLPQDPRLSHRTSKSVGKSVALNEAIPLARGDVVLFTDDDCTVPIDWISRGVETLGRYPQAGAVFGALEAGPHDPLREWVPVFLPAAEVVLVGKAAFIANGGAGANLAVRRSVLSAVGPFDEVLGPGAKFRGLEEFDLFYRILRSSAEVVYQPSNPVVHHGVRSISDGSAQRLLRGYRYGEGAVLAKHLKCGDWITLKMVARIAGWDALEIARKFFHQRRPSGARRLAAFLNGFWEGLRHPLDRDRRLFIPRP